MIEMEKMPKLGFGLMRLPQKDGKIDHEQVCKMVDAYLDAGLNYFDTAYVYHGGLSEVEAREAIVRRHPRESFYLATKLPAWSMHSKADRDRIFEEQLERTGAGYFDYYLLHSIEDGSNYETYEKLDCFRWGLQKKAEGKIRHLGFSFHGTPELLKKLLNDHPEVEFVQIQLNYADWTNPKVQSGRLYTILRERNLPIIVMEPVKGGTLASLTPEQEAVYQRIRPEASAASWALRFVGSLPGVMTILSGMSNEAQMMDNLNTFRHFEPLNEEEQAAVQQVASIMLNTPLIGCTACRYCTDGCPMSIGIPDIFRVVNSLRMYPGDTRPLESYQNLISHGGKAGDCIHCGQCEGVCPQHLPIIELLRKASADLDR
ncbi:MAG: aldo/keto reductase [Clostridia bacterium]|nr:aldo/keto reductase [Clostridia bacterium]